MVERSPISRLIFLVLVGCIAPLDHLFLDGSGKLLAEDSFLTTLALPLMNFAFVTSTTGIRSSSPKYLLPAREALEDAVISRV